MACTATIIASGKLCCSVVVFRRSVSKPCIHEGQIVSGRESLDDGDFAPVQPGSVGQVDGDSGCNSGDESDGSGKGALLDNETASSAAMQARRSCGAGFKDRVLISQ